MMLTLLATSATAFVCIYALLVMQHTLQLKSQVCCCCAGLRRKGAVVADHELERIMAQVDLDGNHTLDFQVRSVPAAGQHRAVQQQLLQLCSLQQHAYCA
jgi:hypothetical protein